MIARRLILVLLFAVCALPAIEVRAQKLHALVVGDTSDWAQWGEYLPNVQMDLLNTFVMFHNNVPESQLDLVNITLEGGEFSETPAGILSVIDEFNVHAGDTLVFYYTGHGGADDQGHYLATERGKIYRSELKRRMVRKSAGLTVILTDSCNVRSDGRQFFAPAPDLQPPRSVTPIFRSLFFEPRGLVDINSSAPNESAFFFAEKDEMGLYRGSLFTGTLTRYIEQWQNRRIGWSILVHDVSLAVHAEFEKNYPKGASVAKGKPRQMAQNVYAQAYPNMPEKQGPRTGLVVRDRSNVGALITGVTPQSPASRVYAVAAGRYMQLTTNQVIFAANGQPVRNTADFVAIVKASPQIMRLSAGPSFQEQTEYLMRLRY